MNEILDMIRTVKKKSGLSDDEFKVIVASVGKPFDRMQIMNDTEGNLQGYDCKICHNKGIVYFRQGDEIVSKNCDCMKVRESLARIKNSGLSNLIEKYTFDRYIIEHDFQKVVKNKAESFLKNNAKWFFIGGQIGCGKSHICTAIVGELLKQGRQARYMQWRDDVVNLKSHANTPDYPYLMKQLQSAEVLYIDDLFKMEVGKNPTSADINIAFEIINHRYVNPDLITIISSEKTISDMLKIDEAVASRICEYTGDYMINISPDIHKNYRLRGVI